MSMHVPIVELQQLLVHQSPLFHIYLHLLCSIILKQLLDIIIISSVTVPVCRSSCLKSCATLLWHSLFPACFPYRRDSRPDRENWDGLRKMSYGWAHFPGGGSVLGKRGVKLRALDDFLESRILANEQIWMKHFNFHHKGKFKKVLPMIWT